MISTIERLKMIFLHNIDLRNSFSNNIDYINIFKNKLSYLKKKCEGKQFIVDFWID